MGTKDETAAWPGSRSIAIAKAFTANAFSTDTAPMSTARLYSMAQPGQMLFGAAATNPFNPACMGGPTDDALDGKVCGGIVVFGGGLPLYSDGRKVGALDTSGDTACADHEVARELRNLAEFNPPTGANADDIQYTWPTAPRSTSTRCARIRGGMARRSATRRWPKVTQGPSYSAYTAWCSRADSFHRPIEPL